MPVLEAGGGATSETVDALQINGLRERVADILNRQGSRQINRLYRRAIVSGSTNIAEGGGIKQLTYDTVGYDPSGMFEDSNDGIRIAIAGEYLVSALVRRGVATLRNVLLLVQVNGVTQFECQPLLVASTGDIQNEHGLTAHDILELEEGDLVTAWTLFLSDSGATLSWFSALSVGWV